MITHTYLITYTMYTKMPKQITFAYKTANCGTLLAEEFAKIAIPEDMQNNQKEPANTPFNINMIFDCGENKGE